MEYKIKIKSERNKIKNLVEKIHIRIKRRKTEEASCERKKKIYFLIYKI